MQCGRPKRNRLPLQRQEEFRNCSLFIDSKPALLDDFVYNPPQLDSTTNSFTFEPIHKVDFSLTKNTDNLVVKADGGDLPPKGGSRGVSRQNYNVDQHYHHHHHHHQQHSTAPINHTTNTTAATVPSISQTDFRRMRLENIKLESTVIDVENELKRLEDDNETLVRNIGRLTAENETLANENEENLSKAVENQHLKEEIKKLNGRSVELKEELKQIDVNQYLLQQDYETAIKEKAMLQKEKNHYLLSSIATTSRLEELEHKKELLELRKEDHYKKKLYFERLQNLKGLPRVFVKVRQLADSNGDKSIIEILGSDRILLKDMQSSIWKKLHRKAIPSSHKTSNAKQFEYQFNHVFTDDDGIDDTFLQMKRYVQMIMNGYNVCFIAHGQSGTGKSTLLLGDHYQGDSRYTAAATVTSASLSPLSAQANRQGNMGEGFFLRAFQLLLQEADQDTSKSYKFLVSAFEIYMEELVCLLSKTKVKLRDLGKIIDISGQNEVPVYSLNSLRVLLHDIKLNRHCGPSELNGNDHASRSHLIILVKCQSQSLFYDGISQNVLLLCDLAGFERESKAKHIANYRQNRLKQSPTPAQDAFRINQSLAALSQVLDCLQHGKRNPPYRDSKLTHFLKPCFTGDAICVLLLTLFNHSDYYNGAQQILQFGNMALATELGKPINQKEENLSKI